MNDFAGKHTDDFVVILVSHDHTFEAFEEYSKHKEHFYRIPFEDRDLIQKLSEGIYSIPTLKIYNGQKLPLEYITDWVSFWFAKKKRLHNFPKLTENGTYRGDRQCKRILKLVCKTGKMVKAGQALVGYCLVVCGVEEERENRSPIVAACR